MRLPPVGQEVGPAYLRFDGHGALRAKPDHVGTLPASQHSQVGRDNSEAVALQPGGTDLGQLVMQFARHGLFITDALHAR